MDKGRRGGQPMWILLTNVDIIKGFLFVLDLFKGSFGPFNAYLVVLGLFLPNTEKKKLKKYLQ